MKRFFLFIYKFFKKLSKIELILIFSGIFISFLILFLFFNFLIENLETKEPTYGGILRIGLTQSINTINPVLAQNTAEKTIVNLIYDSLVRPDGNGSYEYELAKRITPLENGLKYELELKDAYWSNGEKITSDDVIGSFDYFKNYNEITKMFLNHMKLEKLDSSRVLFILDLKDNYFIQKISFVKIVPIKIFSKYRFDEWQKNEDDIVSVSSGPFVLSKKYNIRENIQVFELSRNKFYFKKPYIEKVIFYAYPNFETAYVALKVKEIDFLGGVKPSYLTSSIGRKYNIGRLIIPRVIALFFNSKKINKDIRPINSIDRNFIVKNIFENFAEPSYSIFSPSIEKILGLDKFYEKTEAQNVDYSDIEIIVPDNFFMIKIGEYLEKKFNFKLKIVNIEDINNEIIPNKNYQALLYGLSYNLIPDLRVFFDPSYTFNLTQVDSHELLKIIQNLECGKGDEFRSNLKELENLINNVEPIIFIANPYYIYFVNKDLKNINTSYLNDPSELFVKIEDWYIKEKIKW
ncbi:MAG: ABC transporter substrate-binding protein [Minisyncoccia bacterium]